MNNSHEIHLGDLVYAERGDHELIGRAVRIGEWSVIIECDEGDTWRANIDECETLESGYELTEVPEIVITANA